MAVAMSLAEIARGQLADGLYTRHLPAAVMRRS
jgi:hypothetical protein